VVVLYPTLISRGVSTIESTATSRNSWYIREEINPLARPTFARIKENSPTCERENPTRIIVCKGKPTRKVLKLFTRTFRSSTARVAVRIRRRCSLNILRSSNIPIEMKKILMNMSLNGIIFPRA